MWAAKPSQPFAAAFSRASEVTSCAPPICSSSLQRLTSPFSPAFCVRRVFRLPIGLGIRLSPPSIGTGWTAHMGNVRYNIRERSVEMGNLHYKIVPHDGVGPTRWTGRFPKPSVPERLHCKPHSWWRRNSAYRGRIAKSNTRPRTGSGILTWRSAAIVRMRMSRMLDSAPEKR